MPFFSIVVPIYNGVHLFDPTLHSLLHQSYRDYEIIIVDDGSTDGTYHYLQSFKEQIRLFSLDHGGHITARNFGIEQARGQYVVSFDYDDILAPDALLIYRKVIDHFRQPPVVMAMMSYFSRLEELNFTSVGQERITCSRYSNYFKKNASRGFSNSTLIIRRDRLLQVGGYPATAGVLDDNALLLNLGGESPYIHIDSPVTVGYRRHSSNISANNDKMYQSALQLIALERVGAFQGGRGDAFNRRGIIGTNILSMMKNRFGAKDIGKALTIALNGRSIFLCGLLRKVISKYYPCEKHTVVGG